MTWTLRHPKKHSAFSVQSGSDGGNPSSDILHPIINVHKINEMHSSPSSPSLMIGSFPLSPRTQKSNRFHIPFTQDDIDEFMASITSKIEFIAEINRIQSYMIELEKCFGMKILTKEEYTISVSKLTILFKTLLNYKELRVFSLNLKTTICIETHTFPTHISL